ncbi:MAG: DegV family protein [Anaerolineales bacterium]|nr:DegV family protein [Anaerolineales bacterium]
MSRIAILTDSTAYLSPDMLERHDIHVIPLKVHWGEETLLDGIDITPVEFYTRLATHSTLPSTSQPSMHDFLQVFNGLASQYEGILVPLISSGISGTVASAQAAVTEFKKVPVEVVDTHSTSAGLALVVLAAARAVEQGCSLPEVTQIARNVVQNLHLFFAVDTLKYLHKGGRIGGASRYLGSALSIKPILFFDGVGKIDALERVRTKRKALTRLVELAEEKVGSNPVHVGVIHANAPEEAAEFRSRLAKRLECDQLYTFELSPVIGTHVGPGTIGLALYVE